MKISRNLIVGWVFDIPWIIHYALKDVNARVMIFDEKGFLLESYHEDINAKLITFEQKRFSHRDSVLKAHSELAIWLHQHPDFDTILCSRARGLGFFVSALKRTVKSCSSWNIQWFGDIRIQNDYERANRFLDKEGILLSYLEENQDKNCNNEASFNAASEFSVSNISVVIPFHNRIHYLPQTLSSLLAQEPGFEVVIVNDASDPDQRAELLKLINGDTFSPLSIVLVDSEEKLGASNARNKGVEKSSRDLVFFLDDDDILAPNTLAYCLEALTKENADVVTVSFCYFDGDDIPDLKNQGGTLIQFHDAMDWTSALLNNCIGGISALYRKEAFTGANGFQCGQYAGEEDWQLLLKISFSGGHIVNIPLPLLWYRNTPLSLSKKMLRYDSRQQLLELYKKVLPSSLKNIPELTTSLQHTQQISSDEIAMLGWQLYPLKDRPLYVYGAGKLGEKVIHFLMTLTPSVTIVEVIDRNAEFIQEVLGFKVVTLEECRFQSDAVVIVASVSFIEEIVKKIPSTVDKVITLESTLSR